MPQLGYGVFQMTPEEVEAGVVDALATGYRLVDTATSYQNEEAVGKAIKKSGVPRDEIFITSKLWIADATYEGAKKGYQASLDKLGVDYIDLYLLHQPFNDVFGAWRGLEELYEAGKVKAIGVSNFSSAKLLNFILGNTKIKPMVNQIETHPFCQQNDERKILDEYGIVHEGWAPFAEGNYNIFSNEVLSQIADSHNKSIGQIILRWNMQRGIVAIPKSVRKERIEENFDIFDFELTQEDMDKIAKLDKGVTIVDHEDPEFVKRLYGRSLD